MRSSERKDGLTLVFLRWGRAFVAIFLCVLLIWEGPAYAETGYMEHAKKVIPKELELAKAVIRMKLGEGLFTSAKEIDGRLTLLTNKIETLVSKTNNEASDSINIISSLSNNISADNFQRLVQESVKYRLISAQIEHLLNQARSEANEVLKGETLSSNYCERVIPSLKVDNLSAIPNNSQPNVVSYTKYKSALSGGTEEGGLFSDDPRANMIGILSASTAVAAGIIAYAIVQGVTVAAILSAFSASAASGAIAISATGVGAVIVIAAVAIGAVVAWWVTDRENEKRQREAEQKFKAELDKFQEAKDWYEQHKLSNSAYAALGYEICNSKEWQNTLSVARDKLVEVTKKLEEQIRSVDEYYTTYLVEYEFKINKLLGTYEEKLIDVLSRSYVEDLRKSLLSLEKLNSAIIYFNEEIKPVDELLFKFYTENRTDCILLKSELESRRDQFKVIRDFIIPGLVDDNNRDNSFFIQLSNIMNEILDRFSLKVERCFVRLGEEPSNGIPPIYDP